MIGQRHFSPGNPSTLCFTKMHGAGNDVVVIDLREAPDPSPELCRALGNRHTGIGCDMILGIKKSRTNESVASFSIWTSNGEPSMQCGNGARCVAAWLMREGLVQSRQFRLDSPSGPLAVDFHDYASISINMGRPQFAPEQIPVFGIEPKLGWYSVALGDNCPLRFAAVSMGNPHAVIAVDNVADAPVAHVGRALQTSAWLPQTVNIGFVKIQSRQRIQLRVFEFGAGETLACGSGACAAAAILMRDERIDRTVSVELPGGELTIHWPDNFAPIFMTGPVKFVYEGKFFHAAI